MYATKARRARPEPFAVRPGIAERLGLPYMDFSLGFAAIALAAISVYTLEHATAQDVPGSPGYYSLTGVAPPTRVNVCASSAATSNPCAFGGRSSIPLMNRTPPAACSNTPA